MEGNMMRKLSLLLPALMAVTLLAVTAAAGEIEDQARAVLEKNRTAVVTIKLVVKQKFSMMGQSAEEEESNLEATGTVISPEGLTVVALSATDPTSMYKSMLGGMMREGMQMDSEVSDVQILVEDGGEIPARVVLRDADLDLAYIMPREKPAEAMAYADLSDAGTPRVLDQLVALNRLGKVANRVYSVSFERVEALVDKPRTFYLVGRQPTSTSQGSPAFTLDGKIVGIFVMRVIQNTGGGMNPFSGQNNIIPILLPAADIMEGAKQAPGFEEGKEG
jgi:S1-C subfamily serine protease